ncbi:MAG: AI-2E family transporter [Pseudomonadota bacterium]
MNKEIKITASRIAFLLLLIALMSAFLAIIRPFILPGLLSLLIVIICDPIYQAILKRLRYKRYLAASIATFIVCLCVIIPLWIVVNTTIKNTTQVVGSMTKQLESGQLARSIDDTNQWITSKLEQISTLIPVGYQDFNLRATMLGALKSVSKFVYEHSSQFVKATATVASGLLLVVIFVFVLFAQGSAIYQTLFSLLPLSDEHKHLLTREARQVIAGTFLGMIATSFAQAILIGIGYWIAGIAKPFLWGLIAVGITLIPVIGGPIMYVPTSVILFITGNWGSGLFLFLYGVGIVSTVDNIIKPLVMRGKVDVHPVLLGLSLIGGTLWAGPAGIIIGPLVVALLLAMLRAYQREFGES